MKDREPPELSYIANGDIKYGAVVWVRLLWKKFWQFLRKLKKKLPKTIL